MKRERQIDRGKLRLADGGNSQPLSVEPPPGVLEFRVSAWCGAPECPRIVLTARTATMLDELERSYRCAGCGARDFHAVQSERRRRVSLNDRGQAAA